MSFTETVTDADNAEKVRAVIAITLVGVLIALQFAPSKNKSLSASAQTLAIAVVAFYFGLHAGVTPRSKRERRTEARSGSESSREP